MFELFEFRTQAMIPGGASSEAWDRVSMIAPVKKFGRARLSTGFRIKETWLTSVSGKHL